MNDMTLYLIIALVPLAGSLIAGLFGNKIGRAGAHSVTILGVAVSAVLSAYVLWGFIDGSRAKFDEKVYTWLTMGGLDFSVGFLVDTMTAMMMVVVTGVSLMVHIYTIGYMHDEKVGYQRFFVYFQHVDADYEQQLHPALLWLGSCGLGVVSLDRFLFQTSERDFCQPESLFG